MPVKPFKQTKIPMPLPHRLVRLRSLLACVSDSRRSVWLSMICQGTRSAWTYTGEWWLYAFHSVCQYLTKNLTLKNRNLPRTQTILFNSSAVLMAAPGNIFWFKYLRSPPSNSPRTRSVIKSSRSACHLVYNFCSDTFSYEAHKTIGRHRLVFQEKNNCCSFLLIKHHSSCTFCITQHSGCNRHLCLVHQLWNVDKLENSDYLLWSTSDFIRSRPIITQNELQALPW